MNFIFSFLQTFWHPFQIDIKILFIIKFRHAKKKKFMFVFLQTFWHCLFILQIDIKVIFIIKFRHTKRNELHVHFFIDILASAIDIRVIFIKVQTYIHVASDIHGKIAKLPQFSHFMPIQQRTISYACHFINFWFLTI